MRWRSFRVRLTAWYFAVLAVTFILFGMGMFLAMRASVHAAVDQGLRVRLKGVQRFMERHIQESHGRSPAWPGTYPFRTE